VSIAAPLGNSTAHPWLITFFPRFGIPPPSSSPPGAIISTYSMAQPPRTARSYDSPVHDGSAVANMMIRHDHGWQSYSCYPEPYSTEGDVVTPEKKKNRFGNWLRKNIVWNQNKK
jgi:hypothetical protein